MLTITFFEDGRQRLSSITARGHANWAHSGEDVVCAAVAAILQAARVGLKEHARVKVEARQAKGTFNLKWPSGKRGDASVAAIVQTAKLAIERIAADYPQHVRSENKPVR